MKIYPNRLCKPKNPCCIHKLCNADDHMICCATCHGGKYDKPREDD